LPQDDPEELGAVTVELSDGKTEHVLIPELNDAWVESKLNGRSAETRRTVAKGVFRFFRTAGIIPKPLAEITREDVIAFKQNAVKPRSDDPSRPRLTHQSANWCLSNVRRLLREAGYDDSLRMKWFKGLAKNNGNIEDDELKKNWISTRNGLNVTHSVFKLMYDSCATIEAREKKYADDGRCFPAYRAQAARVYIQAVRCGMRTSSIRELRYGDFSDGMAYLRKIKGGMPRNHMASAELIAEVKKLRAITHRPTAKPGYEDCLFLTYHGEHPTMTWMQDLWKEVRDDAGIDPRFDTTMGRAMSFLMAFQLGASEQAQKIANHKNIQQTLHYAAEAMKCFPATEIYQFRVLQQFIPDIRSLKDIDRFIAEGRPILPPGPGNPDRGGLYV